MAHDIRRGAAIAALFAVLGILLQAILPEWRITWAPERVGRWDDVVPLGLTCLGQVLRRARPLAGLAIAAAGLLAAPLVAGSVTVMAGIAFCDLLYMAVLNGSARASRAVTMVTWGLLGVLALVSLVKGGPREAVRTAMNMTGFLIPVLWGREVRQHRELAEHERSRAERARQVADLDRAAAVAAERARMARDLHDVVAGQLSGIALQSTAALSLPEAGTDTLRRVLGDVRRDSVAALTEMRAMIGLLRDGAADPPAAPAGLAGLGGLIETARSRGLAVEVADHRDQDAAVPAAVDLTAYRIVQEALTNAAKHAPRSSVRLTLRDGAALVVEVVNDLVPEAGAVDARAVDARAVGVRVVGAPAVGSGAAGDSGSAGAAGTGTGLLGLGERAAAVGGWLEAGRVGTRWSLRAELPIGGTP